MCSKLQVSRFSNENKKIFFLLILYETRVLKYMYRLISFEKKNNLKCMIPKCIIDVLRIYRYCCVGVLQIKKIRHNQTSIYS